MKIKLLAVLLASSISFPLLSQSNADGCSKVKSFLNASRQQEHEESLDDYDIHYVKLDLSVDNLSAYVDGSALIEATAIANPLNTMVLELVDVLTVDSVFIDGMKTTDFTHSGELITITLPSSVAMDDTFATQVYYHGDPNSGGFFAGIDNATSSSWGNQVTWTLSESFNAKQWWPSKQVLSDKIDSSDVHITVPNHLKAGSNGVLENVVAVDANTDRYEWKSRYPIAYYLISMAIAEYDEYINYAFEGTSDEIMIQNYLYNNPNVLPTYQDVIDQVPSMIELYSDLYGMYPFKDEKYGHTMAELGGGAMEHQTMTTMTGFSFNTTAHELGHQWFGDQVTCGSWQDIWVNEGFASYSEYLANEFLVSSGAARNWLNEAHNRALQPSGSVYVPEDEADNENRIFSYNLTYKKGGSIIHMIRHELNDDDLFFDIMKTYQTQFKDDVATGIDFKEVVESESGLDFDYFFDQWYFGEGYPTFYIEWTQGNDSLFIDTKQTTSSTVTPLFKMTMEYKLYFEDATDSVIRVDITDSEQSFKLKMPKAIQGIAADPDGDLLIKINGLKEVEFVDEEEEEDTVTAISAMEEAGVRVYPNPSRGSFTIELNGNLGGAIIEVMDFSGKLIDRKIFTNSNQSTIDINGLSPGMYYLSVQKAASISNHKLLVK